MKKILFIHHAVGWGGAPNSLIKLIKNLDSTEYEAEVLLLRNSVVADRLTENNIKFKVSDSIFYKKYYHVFIHSEVAYVKWYQVYRFFKWSILWLLSRYFFSKRELANQSFDIAHLNSSTLTDWLGPAKEKGKVIIHVREPLHKGKFDFLYIFFTSQMRKYADQIVAISKDNANRIGILNKTVVIYNYAEITENLDSEHSYFSKKVLYLGGCDYFKGFYTIVGSLDYLDKDVKIYFGGSYESNEHSQNIIKQFRQRIRTDEKKRSAAIKKMRNHPNAIEIGMISNVNKYLDEACCLVSPFSIPHFSRPVIEAHLHKKAAIVTDVEGIDEIVNHEGNGLVVPKNDPMALAEAINSLTSDGQKAKKLGEAAYEIAKRRFSSENIRMFIALYQRLLSGK